MEVSMKTKTSGFTMLELMICLGIISVMLNLGAPSLTHFKDKNLTDNTARQFLHALKLARSTAITRNTIITFCKSDDGQQCHGNWQQGGIVFVDYNGNANVDEDDEIIYRLNLLGTTGSIDDNLLS